MRVSLTTANNLQEIETNVEKISDRREKQSKKQKRNGGTSGGSRATRIKFKSVLTQPFPLWNEIEDIVGEFLLYLNNSQRSNVIKSLIRFLELKVIMDEYKTNGLLSPTEAVAHVWHVLILETELYRDVVYSIQDFHGRPHRFVHHALFRKYNTKEYHERLERTQRLFKSYYGTEMPTVLMVESDKRENAIAKDLPTQITMDAASLVSESMDELTFDNKQASAWYGPWLPSCYCFENFCQRENKYDNGYQEQVSLLTNPHGLPEE